MGLGDIKISKTGNKEKLLRVMVLNGLVLPGSGHIYLRRKLIGYSMAVVFTVSASTLIGTFFYMMFSYFKSISDFQHADLFLSELWLDRAFLYSFLVSLFVWLFGIIDGYRIASK